MKFLVDAHLPPRLSGFLRAAGHDAIHTSKLTEQNRTTDETLNTLSLNEERVVITKDTDFYYSHLVHAKPWKLLLIRTGNIRAQHLKTLFERHLPKIIFALEQNSMVELDRQDVRIIK